MEADKVSKVVQSILWKGGEVKFLTGTKAPQVDDSLSIDQVQGYKSKAIKFISNYNKDFGTSVILWMIIEATFSRKVMTREHNGRLCRPKHYLHVHPHGLVCVPVEDSKHTISICEGLKELWVKEISKNGCTFADGSRGELSRFGWRTDDINHDNGIGSYLNKMMSPVNNIGIETTMGQLKGENKAGMGMMVALDRALHPECGTWERNEIVRMVETWFVTMFRRNRMNRNVSLFKAELKEFDRLRNKIISDWFNRNYGDYVEGQKRDWLADKVRSRLRWCKEIGVITNEEKELKNAGYIWKTLKMGDKHQLKIDNIFLALHGGSNFQGFCFPLSQLGKQKSKEEEPKPDWHEGIHALLWDAMTRYGYFGLIIDILVGYHNRSDYKAIYGTLMTINESLYDKKMEEHKKEAYTAKELATLLPVCYEVDGPLMRTYPTLEHYNDKVSKQLVRGKG